MNILVSGGYGFMGSHFIKELIRDNSEQFILNIDKLTYAGNKKNLRNVPIGQVVSLIVDIDSPIMYSHLKEYGIDTVVNFAAETHVDRSIHDPEAFLQTDIIGLFNLVQACAQAGVKRFVHISTDEVYGSVDRDRNCTARGTDEALETWSLNPTSPYSASKASADMLLLSYYKTYGFPVIIVRPCNNYGPNQYPEKLIPMAITRLLDDKQVILHGTGSEIREWLYVGDCVEGIKKIMFDGKIGEIYNLGSGIRKTNKEVVNDIVERVMMFPQIDQGSGDTPWVKRVPNRPGNDKRYAINSDKFLVGVVAPSSDYFYVRAFDDCLDKTIKWYKDNKGWWEDVNLDANMHSRAIDKLMGNKK